MSKAIETCPICSGKELKETYPGSLNEFCAEKPGKEGIVVHPRVKFMVCTDCGYIMMFSQPLPTTFITDIEKGRTL